MKTRKELVDKLVRTRSATPPYRLEPFLSACFTVSTNITVKYRLASKVNLTNDFPAATQVQVHPQERGAQQVVNRATHRSQFESSSLISVKSENHLAELELRTMSRATRYLRPLSGAMRRAHEPTLSDFWEDTASAYLSSSVNSQRSWTSPNISSARISRTSETPNLGLANSGPKKSRTSKALDFCEK